MATSHHPASGDRPPERFLRPACQPLPRRPRAQPDRGGRPCRHAASAAFIRAQADQLDAITVTLDSHQRFDIAHPGFWQTGAGQRWRPSRPSPPPRCVQATSRRAMWPPCPARWPTWTHSKPRAATRLAVWPVHCEIGSWGHGIHADVLAACGDWQLQRQRAVRNVFKGTNPWTEHYSAIEAEVPDADDTSTALNTVLLQSLGQADVLLIAGEASTLRAPDHRAHRAAPAPPGARLAGQPHRAANGRHEPRGGI